MIEIDVQPKEIDFAGNPIACRVHGTNYIVAIGAKAKVVLTKVGTFNPAMNFHLTFLDFDLNFIVHIASEEGGLYIPQNATIDQLAEYLNYNYDLTKYFTIRKTSATQVTIEAIEKGTLYNIDADVSGCAALTKAATAGANFTVQANYKIIWQFFYKHKYQVNYSLVPDQLADVDQDGDAKIPVGDLLSDCLNRISPELPEFNTIYLKEAKKILFPFYLKLAEYYGASPKVLRLYPTDLAYAINGRLPFNKFPGHDFYSDLQTDMSFLTNRKRPAETYKSAQQFLAWVNTYRGTYENVYLFVDIYQSNGPMQIFIKDWISNVAEHDCLYLPAGFDQLEITEFNKCWKYKVYLKGRLTTPGDLFVISEKMTFYVKEKPLFAKQILLRNDYGAYETLIVEKVQNKYDIDTLIYEKDLQYNYQLPEGELITKTEEAYNKFTVRTGTMTKQDADNMCELLYNNDAYLIGEHQYIPIVIEKGTVELSDEADDLFIVKFDYRFRINGKLSEDA